MPTDFMPRLPVRKGAGLFKPQEVAGMLLLVWLAACTSAQAWGPQGRQLVSRWAIATLPEPIQAFFRAHSSAILNHVNDPDVWMKKDRYEQFRHYIYLDAYGRFPYLKLPHAYKAAVQQYGSRHILRDGTLPWQIGEFSLRVTNDMRAQDWNKAVMDAAALGYYVADAHDPLKTTQNFNGQLTQETGLATRFSIDLVARYKNFIVFHSATAAKIADPTEYAFGMVLEANTWVDRVLLEDNQALDDLPSYNVDYFDRFYTGVGSVISQELSGAAHDIGSYWYTAWMNAGEPPLPAH
jgi:hypothetical protein